MAWEDCHKLHYIWKSNLSKSIKVRLFLATVDYILFHGYSMDTHQNSWIRSCRMLKMLLYVYWRNHITNTFLYGSIVRVTTKINERWLKLAGYGISHLNKETSKLELWQPTDGTRNRERLSHLLSIQSHWFTFCWWSQNYYSRSTILKRNCLLGTELRPA